MEIAYDACVYLVYLLISQVIKQMVFQDPNSNTKNKCTYTVLYEYCLSSLSFLKYFTFLQLLAKSNWMEKLKFT